ncbi:hypothetical protein CBW65_05800 [Tumebacillus avium]|uniref:Uncharacterized protein n=1 Tax=Tumebacillus avium TaxID=1903704 RepID=A0A1Y0IJF9_9BACL|nr:Ger(x)C family spore germination protein [Tumebacillus avium]ARU60651.1 hypothetical protein CBW65_05800 [Tumebacillus avium]
MRGWRMLLVTLLMAVMLTGCWDRTEVNDIAIVLATAYDVDKDGKYRLAVQVPLPGQLGGKSGGGGGTSGSKSFYVDSSTGVSIRDASQKVQQRMPRQLFYAHRRILVIGEELAKKGIRPVFDAAARIPENRLTASIVIAKGNGYDLLSRQPRFERFSSEGIREIVNDESVFNTSLKDAAQHLSLEGSDAMIPLVKVKSTEGTKDKNEELQFASYALFHDDKMVAVMDQDGSEGIRWLKQQVKPYTVTLTSENGETLLVNIYKGNAKVKPRRVKDHFEFEVHNRVTAYVLENVGGGDLSVPENVQKINRRLEEHITQTVYAAVDEIHEHKVDVAGLGLVVARNFPKEWRSTYNDNWYEELEKTKFHVTTVVNISRIGLTSENLAKRAEVE